MASGLPAVETSIDFLLFGWGVVFTTATIAVLVSKFDLFHPVVRFLYPEADDATRQITARLAEIALWLSVPLAFSTQINLEALFGAGIGALFIAYLVREPLKDKLTHVPHDAIVGNR